MKRAAYIGFLLFFTFPLIVLLLYAVAPGWRFPVIIPSRFNAHGWLFLQSQGGAILRHGASSILYSLTTVPATLLISIAPAHVLARYDFPFKNSVEGLLLAPALVPAVTFSMGVHIVFIKVGLADTFWGVVAVLTVFTYPFMLRALIAGYQAFGREFELCAENLGASRITRILRIDVPLLMPSIVAGGSVVFLISFSEYFLVFLIGGGAVPSYTGYLFPFLISSDRAAASLLTLLFLVVPILFFIVTDMLMRRVYGKMGLYG